MQKFQKQENPHHACHVIKAHGGLWQSPRYYELKTAQNKHEKSKLGSKQESRT